MSSYTSAHIQRGLGNGDFTLLTSRIGKANVWKNFFRIKDSQGYLLSGYVACKNCNKCYHYDSKTTGSKNLSRHASRCTVGPKINIPVGPAIGMGNGISVHAKAKEAISKAAVHFVCQDLRPFVAIEGKGLEKLATELIMAGSKYGKVTVKDVLPGASAVECQTVELANKLTTDLGAILPGYAARNRVAFTADFWMDDYKKLSYLDITAYILTDYFNLKQYTLGCTQFAEEEKTSENILSAITAKLAEYGLSMVPRAPEMIGNGSFCSSFWFTTGSGPTMIGALKDYNQLLCAGHRVNTVLRTAWDGVVAVSDNAKEFKRACQELVQFAKQGNLQQQLNSSIKTDSPIRWNSFYFVIKSILKNYGDLQFKLIGTNNMGKLAAVDKDMLQAMVGFLKVFKKATDFLEAEGVPTLQNVVLTYYHILQHCLPNPGDDNTIALFKAQISQLLPEIMKLEPIHWAAVYLDPSVRRMKMLTPADRMQQYTLVKSYLTTLPLNLPALPQPNLDPATPKKAKLDLFQQFRSSTLATVVTETPTSLSDEFTLYEEMPSPPDDMPLLSFWSRNCQNLPRLSQAAGMIFVVPASCAPSERSFTAAGRTIEERRGCLKPDSVDAILRAKGYLANPDIN